MALISDIRSREHGLRDVCRFSVGSIVDRMYCQRLDEHHIEAQEFGECTPPLACRFSNSSPHILAAADEDGGILIINTNIRGIQAIDQDWLAHKNAVFDIDWMPEENKLLTASGDQTVALWDVEQEEKIGIFKGHTSSVKTVRFAKNNKWLFATGARDGHIMLFDHRVKEKDGHIPAVNVIRNAHKCVSTGSTKKRKGTQQQDNPQSVTAVVFQDDHTVLSSGSVDGCIKVWDLRKTYTVLKSDPLPKHSFNYAGSSIRTHGFSCLTLDSTGSNLFASCMDNVIYQYDATAYGKSPVAYYQGHKNTTFYIKTCLSPDEKFLLSGSSDNHAYVWDTSNPRAQPWTLQGHSGEVSAVEWCPTDIGRVVTVSDDSTLRIWRLAQEHEVRQALPGEKIGSSQRSSEKSVGVNTIGLDRLNTIPQKVPPQTPKKGTMLSPSPVKMSPALKKSIAALSSSSSKQDVKSASKGKSEVTKTASPSIMSWFSKSSTQKPKASPCKKTPRKLLITPKKQNVSSDQKNSPGCLPVPPNSVKRKLYDADSPPVEQQTKRHKLNDGFFKGHVHDENSCDGIIAVTPHKSPSHDPSRILLPFPQNSIDASPGIPKQTDITDDKDFKTPSKTDIVKNYQSPTVNLPNYVFNPQPRTPIATTPTGPKTPKTNWLAEIRRTKQDSISKEANNVDTDAKGSALKSENTPKRTATKSAKTPKGPASKLENTPRSTKSRTENITEKELNLDTTPKGVAARLDLRTAKSTPRRKPPMLKRRGSIVQYFSPDAHNKKQKTDS